MPLTSELERLHAHLDGLVSAAVPGDGDGDGTRAGTLELLESLRGTLDELRSAQRELERRGDELAASREALAEERRLYEDFFQLAPDAYLVTDAAGVVLDLNRAAATLFGGDKGFLVRKPLAALVSRASRAALRDAFRRLRLGESPTVDLEVVVRSGAPVRVSATAAAADHAGHRIWRWILRDVTAQRRREAELRLLTDELEARVEERTRELAAVIEHLPLGVALVDAASRRVLRHNRRAAELLGGDGADVRTLDAYVSEVRLPGGASLEEADWPSSRAFSGETVIGERIHVVTKDGTEHIFELSAAPVADAAGRVGSAVVVFHDVADRERRERAFRTFVTNAAHELGTPVAGIIAAVEALQGGAKDDDANRDRFLEHIARESGRLERLNRALLVLARAQARSEPAALAVIPLEPLLTDIVRGVSPRPGVQIEASCASDVAALANSPLLEQALINLAGNAARYTERGAIRLSAAREGDQVEVVVADTGPGIPAEVQERLFERFVRGDGVAGFGLGLAIARDYVEATGGSLTITSSGENGTQAIIRVPGARLVEGA